MNDIMGCHNVLEVLVIQGENCIVDLYGGYNRKGDICG